jgi:putative flippase GtrA
MKKIETLIRKYWEQLSYLAIGGLTTVVSYGLYYGLLKLGLLVDIANLLSILGAVIFAYITNKLIVFRSHCANLPALVREILSFFGARAVALVVELVGVHLLAVTFELNAMLSKVILSIIVIILNYILSKWLVFRKSKLQ